MSSDPIDEFLAGLQQQHPPEPPEPSALPADPFAGSEPVGPANPAPPHAQPLPDLPAGLPAGSIPAVVATAPTGGDVLNTSMEAALAELVRRVEAVERYLRRLGADL